MPFPGIPGQILDESRVKYPLNEGLLAWCRRVPSNLKRSPGALLRENSDGLMIGGGNLKGLVGRKLDTSARHDPVEFENCGGFSVLCEDQVYPIKRAAGWGRWVGDTVSNSNVIIMLV